jgi:hypothetical protein
MDREYAIHLNEGGELPAKYHVYGLEFEVDESAVRTQLEVILAIKDYCEAALNGDAGYLWDVVPNTWSELGDDLKTWINAWELDPTQKETYDNTVEFVRRDQGGV